jgi:hypothetical protein
MEDKSEQKGSNGRLILIPSIALTEFEEEKNRRVDHNHHHQKKKKKKKL